MMLSIFLSLFEQLLIVMSVLTIENAVFKRKIDIKMVLQIVIVFIILFGVLCYYRISFPASVFNILFIYVLVERKFSFQSLKEFSFSYLVAVLGNVMCTVIFNLLNIEVFDYCIISSVVLLLFTISNLILNRIWHVYISQKILVFISLIVGFLSFYLISLNNDYSSKQIVVYHFSFSIFIVFLIFIILLLFVKEYCEHIYELKKKQDYKKMVQVQNEYIKQVIASNEILRKFKHDYQAQLLMLETYLSNGDVSNALTCLHDVRGEMHNIQQVSSHVQIDSVISYFINRYPSVKIEVEDAIVGEMNMPDMQVYSLLYNLISNACEASCQLKSPFVSILCKSQNHTLYITIKNNVLPTFDFSFIQNKKTNKKDKNEHGIGLSIIQDIVVKHNGIIQYDVQDNVLINEIVLFDVIS